eukprot:1319154-Amorphochlora_amoeboformis.AAC.1
MGKIIPQNPNPTLTLILATLMLILTSIRVKFGPNSTANADRKAIKGGVVGYLASGSPLYSATLQTPPS